MSFFYINLSSQQDLLIKLPLKNKFFSPSTLGGAQRQEDNCIFEVSLGYTGGLLQRNHTEAHMGQPRRTTHPSRSWRCGDTERAYSTCPRILFSISSPGETVSRLESIICSEEHVGRQRNTYMLNLCRPSRGVRAEQNSPSVSQMLGNGCFSISSAYTFLSPNYQNLECR